MESENQSLLKIKKEQQRAMNVMINEKDLKKKLDEIRKDTMQKKAEIREKQNILRKQDKQMKDQHEALIVLDEKCRKLNAIVAEKKAGIGEFAEKAKSQQDIEKLELEIKQLEKVEREEKVRYKQMITEQENKIKDMNNRIDSLNLELKAKDQVTRYFPISS